MAFLINPTLGYFLVVAGISLLLMSAVNPRSTVLKVGMAFCFIGAGYEFAMLRVNPWAFLVVALSPLPFFVAIRQTAVRNPLFLLTLVALSIGALFIFVDENEQSIVNFDLAGLIAVFCCSFVWISTVRKRNAEGARLSNDPGSVVGLIGEVKTDIELHSAGSVLVEGEIWQARSDTPIPAGSMVRVLRQDGYWLTVKKVENIPNRKE